jgi:NAD(P)-dependent dehydrogenase (short-subunit alcohol dehydrogenase family)
MSKIVLITGTSTGIGLYTAALLAASGYTVYATMRNTSKKDQLEQLTKDCPGNIHIIALDVNIEKTITDCIQVILEKEGRIDVLINNAGAGFIRSVEKDTMQEIENVMNVNFNGTIR